MELMYLILLAHRLTEDVTLDKLFEYANLEEHATRQGCFFRNWLGRLFWGENKFN